MRPSSFLFVLAFGLDAAFARRAAPRATQNPAGVTGTRKSSFLKNVAGIPPVPPAAKVAATAFPVNDIQGDIIVGMQKPKELFYFFSIGDAASFKTHLAKDIAPILTSAEQMLNTTQQPLVLLNMAFSQAGLTTLGVLDSLGDTSFTLGQIKAIQTLAEKSDGWQQEFKGTGIHGVMLLASDTVDLINQQVAFLETTFGSSMRKVYALDGAMRPGALAGHEMFGYKDGIAQPALDGFGDTHPGQLVVPPGMILTGMDGDSGVRPVDGWMTGGSFLVFRQLEQLVPEFDKFLLDNAPIVEGKTLQERADLLGARMVGRWKSGAPIDLSPNQDDPALGNDVNRNNNFDFTHDGLDFKSDQSRCPFSAHIRKSRPRADVSSNISIMRSGIPYGGEVTAAEAASNTTSQARGLAFVSYQSSIAKGFEFIQKAWVNAPGFVFGKDVQPGFDPIVGQNFGGPRNVTGLDPNDTHKQLTLPLEFVVSRGGEYFFSPPISAFTGRLVA
ncbi:DyP-type peroxidase [Auricularia subglabra TFB-10046 SS5]|nr:DyP-type peroxidase [Auricularia subglabra TFB-10046 SS5]